MQNVGEEASLQDLLKRFCVLKVLILIDFILFHRGFCYQCTLQIELCPICRTKIDERIQETLSEDIQDNSKSTQTPNGQRNDSIVNSDTTQIKVTLDKMTPNGQTVEAIVNKEQTGHVS